MARILGDHHTNIIQHFWRDGRCFIDGLQLFIGDMAVLDEHFAIFQDAVLVDRSEHISCFVLIDFDFRTFLKLRHTIVTASNQQLEKEGLIDEVDRIGDITKMEIERSDTIV